MELHSKFMGFLFPFFKPTLYKPTEWKIWACSFKKCIHFEIQSLWVTISFNEKRAIPVLPLDFKVTKDIILNWFWVLKPKYRLHPLQNTQVILSIFKTKKVFRSKENTINVISTKQQLVSHTKRAQLIMMVNEIRITSNFQRLIIPVFITYFSK